MLVKSTRLPKRMVVVKGQDSRCTGAPGSEVIPVGMHGVILPETDLRNRRADSFRANLLLGKRCAFYHG
jgi:hypothetical protein